MAKRVQGDAVSIDQLLDWLRQREEEMAALLAELRERDGLTLIVVTHDPEPLTPVCPRTVRLDHGRIIGDAVTLSSPRVPQSEAA